MWAEVKGKVKFDIVEDKQLFFLVHSSSGMIGIKCDHSLTNCPGALLLLNHCRKTQCCDFM